MIIRAIKENDEKNNDGDDDDDDDDEGYRLLMTPQQWLLPASISRPPRDFPLVIFCYFSITVIHFSVSSSSSSAFSPNPDCVSISHWCLSSVAHYSDFYWFCWLAVFSSQRPPPPSRSKQCVKKALVCCQKKVLFKEHVHDFIVALHSYIM